MTSIKVYYSVFLPIITKLVTWSNLEFEHNIKLKFWKLHLLTQCKKNSRSLNQLHIAKFMTLLHVIGRNCIKKAIQNWSQNLNPPSICVALFYFLAVLDFLSFRGPITSSPPLVFLGETVAITWQRFLVPFFFPSSIPPWIWLRE